MPLFLLPEHSDDFPDPALQGNQDFSAISRTVSLNQIMPAYRKGIFPWPNGDSIVLWTSPYQRTVIDPKTFRFSRRIKRIVRRHDFELRIDTDFAGVIRNCAGVFRKKQQGTWINENVIRVYCEMHQMGFAHSFETYLDGKQVGGIYGICVGQVFSGESMFSLVSGGSTFAFAGLVNFCRKTGIRLIDCQVPNDHLTLLGSECISRETFLTYLQLPDITVSQPGSWRALCRPDIQPASGLLTLPASPAET